jgi:hypothetical protein
MLVGTERLGDLASVIGRDAHCHPREMEQAQIGEPVLDGAL